MTSTTTNTLGKVAALAAGFAMVLSVVAAPIAHADTTTTTTTSSTTSLQAQIASLQAQLAASQGTTAASVTFTRDLTVGSRGADVTALQNWLISHGDGMSIAAGATGYFGAQTKAAVAAYQSQNGISPAAGYFGPKTRAAVNAGGSTTTTTTTTTAGCAAGAAFSSTTGQACGTTTTTTGTTGPLAGGEGSLDNFKIVGATNTAFNQADTEQAYGFEFKANGSDLQVNRVDYDIYNSTGTGTVRPWNVFQTATLMHGNTTVGTVDVSNQSNWSQDGTDVTSGNQIYRVRFDGLKDVVKMGSTADYYLSLTTQNSISNGNTGGTYKLYLAGQGVRATDAMGIQQYTSSSNGSVATLTVANSTNGSVVLSTGSDNPQTTTVQADSQNVTTGVTLATFTLQAKNANVTLYSLPIKVATTTSAASAMIRSIKLYQGSTLLDTESIAAGQGATTTFQNLNLQIPAGTTESFKVVADINKVAGGFAEGSSVTVSVPGYGQDIENGSNTVSLSGSMSGNPITFRSLGLAADAAPTTSASVANNGGNTTTQTGTFTFVFNVTAFGQDAYIASTSNSFVATVYDYTNNNTATSSAFIASSLTSTADRSGLGNYVVHSGQTKQVTVQTTVNSGLGHTYFVVLNSLKFNTSDSAAGLGSDTTVTLPTSYQSSQLKINS